MAEIEAQFETMVGLAAEHARLAAAIASLCSFEASVGSPGATAAALGRFCSRVQAHLADLARLHLELDASIRAGLDRYSDLECR